MLCIPDIEIVTLISSQLLHLVKKEAQSKFVATSAAELNWTDKFYMFFTFMSVRYYGTFSASCAATLFKIESRNLSLV